MKNEMINTILLAGVLVVLIVIAIILAINLGAQDEDGEVGPHTHDEYVEKTGDTMTGDLHLQSLYASGVVSGDGSGIWNMNASRISTGKLASERLPSDLDADTLDGYDSSDFLMAAHTHDDRYYTKTESDAKYASISHTHPPGDADTLDGLDSTDFAMAAHTHDDRYYTETESDARYALIAHTHDDRYYNKTESDARYALIGHTHPPGDADTLDGYDSLDFAMVAHTHDDRYYTETESDARYALIAHTHNASHITEGELDEARLPQYAIDSTEIENGFGLVPSGTIVMWNGTIIPEGWALCDGNNGTPDLRGMFIVGYDPSDIDYDVIGGTGGEKTHTLTINEMPSHSHSVTGTTSVDGEHSHSYEDRYSINNVLAGMAGQARDDMENFQTKSTQPAGDHSHTVSGTALNTGGNQPHENRPPYYVLAFIMKL